MTDVDEEIRKIPAQERYIRFSIKCDDTRENQKVHEAFKEFAKLECDNNYTIALRKLLESYQQDWKYESLSMRLMSVESAISAIEREKEEEKKKPEEDEGVF